MLYFADAFHRRQAIGDWPQQIDASGREKLQSIMPKIRAQHSTGSARQSFRWEDVLPPPPVAEPSSSHLVVTTDAQIAVLMQQIKVLTETVQSLQQQQTQQQQQPSMEQSVAQSVPSRHNRHPRCSPSLSLERRSSRHSHQDGQPHSRHFHRATHHSRHSSSPSHLNSIRKKK